MTSSEMLAEHAARLIRRLVTTAVLVIALLTFAFGFGNGWQLGLALGVPGWIAPLVAPAVDLSVMALLVSLQYIRGHDVGGKLYGPRLLLVLCGLITFALNTARPILADQPGRACFDAISPLLLIGWSEVGPRLLALLHQSVGTDGDGRRELVRPSSTNLDRSRPSSRLVQQARRLDREHRRATGRSIPRDKLRTALHISNATAGELLRLIRAPPK